MIRVPLAPAAHTARRSVFAGTVCSGRRGYAMVFPVSSTHHSHRIAVVGGGTAGLAISHQLLRSGKFAKNDIAIIDPSTNHDYQPGWTLVGGGLKNKH